MALRWAAGIAVLLLVLLSPRAALGQACYTATGSSELGVVGRCHFAVLALSLGHDRAYGTYDRRGDYHALRRAEVWRSGAVSGRRHSSHADVADSRQRAAALAVPLGHRRLFMGIRLMASRARRFGVRVALAGAMALGVAGCGRTRAEDPAPPAGTPDERAGAVDALELVSERGVLLTLAQGSDALAERAARAAAALRPAQP